MKLKKYRKKIDKSKIVESKLRFHKKLKFKTVYNIAFANTEVKIIKEMVSRKKTRKFQKLNVAKLLKRKMRIPLREGRVKLATVKKKVLPKSFKRKKRIYKTSAAARNATMKSIHEVSYGNDQTIIIDPRNNETSEMEKNSMNYGDFDYNKIQKMINEKIKKIKNASDDYCLEEELEYLQILVHIIID